MGFVKSIENTSPYRDVTGQTAADAAKKAGKNQQAAAEEARGILAAAQAEARGQLTGDPYQRIQNLIDPQSQAQFLEGNPMFQAALANSNEQLKRNAALSGKLSSGGAANALFQNYLAQGNDFINQQFNRLGTAQNLNTGLANLGLSSAGQQADLLTGGVAAREAGRIGAANARAAGTMNLLGMGASLGASALTGGMGGGLGGLFGGGQQQAAPVAPAPQPNYLQDDYTNFGVSYI